MTHDPRVVVAPGDHPSVDDLIEAGATAEEVLAHATPLDWPEPADAPAADGGSDADVERIRPTIRTGADVHRVVDQSIHALRGDEGIYQRAGRLTRIVRVTDTEATAERAAAGTPQLRDVASATLLERLTAVAEYQRFDARAKGWLHTVPPMEVVAAVMARGEYPGIRPITSIIETPSMRPDGSVIDRPGYDAATGYVYLPQRAYPAIPLHPTIDDARAALRELEEPWLDFPATTPAGKAVPLAAALTHTARPAIVGAVPAFFHDASTRGSGKTLVVRCVIIIAQGREAALITWSEDPAETEKTLGALALRGATSAIYDNVVGTFGGAALDKVLTATDRVSLRVLGKSEQPELPWRATILATGNNAVLGRDTARRTLVQRLEPGVERPEERDTSTYRIPQLERWCMEHHPRLVAAALTLLRAYVVAGRPSQGLTAWGSYQPWADLIANAIVWAGGPNVLEARATVAAEEDETTAALRALLPLWRAFAADGCSARHAIDALYSPDYMRGQAAPDGWDDLRAAIETLAPPSRPGQRPDPKQLGYALRRAKGAVLSGLRIESELDRKKTAVWVVREAGR